MKNLFNFITEKSISNTPWDYYFFKNLDEKEYPRYLAKLFYMNTGEKLPLKYDFKNKSWIIDKKKCKTFNQKIQWLKLYDATDLKRKCTDKAAVRDYVAEKIGSEYLKPVLQVIPSINCDCHVIARNNGLEGDEAIQGKRSQKAMYENSEIKSNNNIGWTATDFFLNLQIQSYYYQPVSLCKSPRSDGKIDALHPKFNDVTTYFDQIDWENLPNSFVIKCNHGCKWQFIIKDKEAFLKNKRLFDIVKRNITGWLEQEFWCFQGFEMQYKNIKSAIIIEPLMRENINTAQTEIEVFCFKGIPKLVHKIYPDKPNTLCVYDENLNNCNIKFLNEYVVSKDNDKGFLKSAVELSAKLSKNFNFIRVDWILYKNKIYFGEMTFTPYSGFAYGLSKKDNNYLGGLIQI